MRKKRVQIDQGAWIYQRIGTSAWYLDLIISGRPRRRISLQSRSREHALRVARKLVKEAHAEQWDLTLPREIPFDDLLCEYTDHARTRNTPRTMELNLQVLSRFRDHAKNKLGSGRKFMISHITPDLVESFVRRRKKDGIANATINRNLGALSTALNFACRKGYLRANPVERVEKLPTVRNRIPDTLDSTQVQRLLQEAARPVPLVGPGSKGKGGNRDRVTPIQDMILFALNTGARLGELLYVEWKDIDLDRKLISFRCKPEHRLKDSEDRQVRANEEVLEMLRRRRLQAGSCRWVFPSSTGEVIDRRNALRELKIVARRAGVPNANFQVLRRIFATACATSGMPAFILKALMGHASVRTTERYYIGNAGGQCWVPPTMGSIG